MIINILSRRKEGDVDKVQEQYDMGWRAYLRADGTQMFQCPYGDTDAACCSRFWKEEWQALRAYQDAERKKGVPINMSDEKREFWYLRDYDFIHEDGTVEKYTFDSVEGQPVINVDWNFLLTGQFTNFRWKAGYPKGGQNG